MTDKLKSTCRNSMPRTLAAHLHALPQEIFDIVYNMTFTCPATTIFIDSQSYRSPAFLQIDQYSRHLFASNYCASNTFVCSGEETAKKWLMSLEARYRGLVVSVKCILFKERKPGSGTVKNYEHCIEKLNAKLRFEYLFGKDVAEKVEFCYEGEA